MFAKKKEFEHAQANTLMKEFNYQTSDRSAIFGRILHVRTGAQADPDHYIMVGMFTVTGTPLDKSFANKIKKHPDDNTVVFPLHLRQQFEAYCEYTFLRSAFKELAPNLEL